MKLSNKQKIIIVTGGVLLVLVISYFSEMLRHPQTLPETSDAVLSDGGITFTAEDKSLWTAGDGKITQTVQTDSENMSGVMLESTQKKVVCLLPDEAIVGGLAVRNGKVYFTDAGRKKVYCISAADGNPVWESTGEDKFILPSAAFPLSFSPEGNLWVANTGKKTLEQLDPATGKFIAAWKPSEKDGFKGCCNPVAFAALAGGRFVCVEKGTRQARIFSPSGNVDQVLLTKMSDDYSSYAVSVDDDGKITIYDKGVMSIVEPEGGDGK